MNTLVHQLGELFLQAVPTAVIVLVFYLIMRALFFKPLLRVMDERDARTRGAKKAAEAAQVAADEKVKQYQEALRHARAKVYAEQEAARKKLLDERAASVKEARKNAAGEVGAAKNRIAADAEAAKRELETSVDQLASEIARRVLQTPGSPSREAR